MRASRRLLPSSLFTQVIEEASKELSVQQAFLEEAIRNPILIFSKADEKIGSKSLVSYLMNGRLYEDEKIIEHDYQVFIADLADRFLQEWASKKGITEVIKADVRNVNTYPSIFAIYHEDMELIQFNVFERYYGVREKALDEETIRAKHKNNEEQIEKSLEPLLKKVKDYEWSKTNPHQYIRYFYKKKKTKNVIVIGNGKTRMRFNWNNIIKLPYYELCEHCAVVFKKTSYEDKLDVKIKNVKTSVEEERKKLSEYPSVDHYVEKNKAKENITKKLIPLFEEFGYRLETEKYNLY